MNVIYLFTPNGTNFLHKVDVSERYERKEYVKSAQKLVDNSVNNKVCVDCSRLYVTMCVCVYISTCTYINAKPQSLSPKVYWQLANYLK